ncbi:RING-H2 finger protein ATL3-like [Iris pallida]|uniref:RING-H2 finger protein ATL3-like n=1 Tax=Iris pallida TaxID=29817 RepID=A0AAX6II18_IRIPA|nr:RING-H2 finger protein ATL3-like [Iris pallida]
MLSGIAVLFAIVIFILFLHLYVRWHVRRRYDRRRRRSRLFSEAASSEDQNQRSAPRGLEKEVLNSLAVEVFSAGDGDAEEEADCAVCINEFDEGRRCACSRGAATASTSTASTCGSAPTARVRCAGARSRR